MHDRRRLAWIGTGLLALVCLGAIMVVGDRPRWRTDGYGDPATRAAVAFRDREIPFFQWGTELYMVPLLADAYAEVAYVTQRDGEGLERLQAALESTLARHPQVDLFLAVHGGRALPSVIGRLDPALRARLRLVYSTGCGDGFYGPWWLEQGADAFVGHDGQLSMSPIFLVYFLRRWSEGLAVAAAVEAANAQTATRLGWLTPAADTGRLIEETRARVVGDATLRIGR